VRSDDIMYIVSIFACGECFLQRAWPRAGSHKGRYLRLAVHGGLIKVAHCDELDCVTILSSGLCKA
jgi:hypothetical protein